MKIKLAILAVIIPLVIGCHEPVLDEYTVFFDSKGGSNVEPQIVTKGDKASRPKAPVKTELKYLKYNFDDWYTSTDEGLTLSSLPFDFDTEITTNIVLYAKWNEIKNEEVSKNIVFTVQPSCMTVEKNTEYLLTCKAECDCDCVLYQWYEVSDISGNNRISMSDGKYLSTSDLIVSPFYEKGIRYFVCSAAIKNVCGGGYISIVNSEVIGVAYTGRPIIYINTPIELENITKDDYCIINDFTVSSEKDNIFNDVMIKGRGNSSWGMPKKGYNLKFKNKQSLFGLSAAKKYCIIPNYRDKTLIRNKFAEVLGTEIYNSVWNPSGVLVDVVFNGEYIGNYLFSEKITLSKGRVELPKGGFIIEVECSIDRASENEYFYKSDKGYYFCLKDTDNLTEELKNNFDDVIQNVEDILYGESFLDDNNGWKKYIDEKSVIDWFIINEFSKNLDAVFHSSVYMFYNPSDNKLYMGPCWDFDYGFGNCCYNDDNSPENWYIKDSIWISRMFEDSEFCNALKSRWNQKKNELKSTFSENGLIQNIADNNSISANLNFSKWKILGTHVWPNPNGYEKRTTYQSEIDYMKNWLKKRYEWLDNAINNL